MKEIEGLDAYGEIFHIYGWDSRFSAIYVSGDAAERDMKDISWSIYADIIKPTAGI